MVRFGRDSEHGLRDCRRGATSIGSAFEGHASRSAIWLLTRHGPARPIESAMGLVSRVAPVQTATRNCTADEGGPVGFGDQVADPKPPRAALVKSYGRERRGNVGT